MFVESAAPLQKYLGGILPGRRVFIYQDPKYGDLELSVQKWFSAYATFCHRRIIFAALRGRVGKRRVSLAQTRKLRHT
jgi:hypothetical protein